MILISWFAAQETFLIIINVENSLLCNFIFSGSYDTFHQIFWWIIYHLSVFIYIRRCFLQGSKGDTSNLTVTPAGKVTVGPCVSTLSPLSFYRPAPKHTMIFLGSGGCHVRGGNGSITTDYIRLWLVHVINSTSCVCASSWIRMNNIIALMRRLIKKK